MLTAYIDAAMHHARYEILADDNSYYGAIPELPGVWANAADLESCRDELRSVLEEWIAMGLASGKQLPALDGVDLSSAVPS